MVELWKKRGLGWFSYCCDEHGNTDDTGGEKRGGIAAHTELFKDRWGVVEHGVHAGPLLEVIC